MPKKKLKMCSKCYLGLVFMRSYVGAKLSYCIGKLEVLGLPQLECATMHSFTYIAILWTPMFNVKHVAIWCLNAFYPYGCRVPILVICSYDGYKCFTNLNHHNTYTLSRSNMHQNVDTLKSNNASLVNSYGVAMVHFIPQRTRNGCDLIFHNIYSLAIFHNIHSLAIALTWVSHL